MPPRGTIWSRAHTKVAGDAIVGWVRGWLRAFTTSSCL
jgi:hypothetical protein